AGAVVHGPLQLYSVELRADEREQFRRAGAIAELDLLVFEHRGQLRAARVQLYGPGDSCQGIHVPLLGPARAICDSAGDGFGPVRVYRRAAESAMRTGPTAFPVGSGQTG